MNYLFKGTFKVGLKGCLLLGFIFIIQSCDKYKDRENDNPDSKQVIARVNDKILTFSRIKDQIPKKSFEKDSSGVARDYVNNWVKNQLLIQKALKKKYLNDKEIKQKVEDYKNSLIIHKFKENYVEKNLDTVISGEKIKAYFKENKKTFQLKRNLLKCIFIKIDKEAPNIDKMKSLIAQDTSNSLDDLKSYAYQFASSYNLNTNKWFEFESLATNTPFITIKDKASWLKNNKYTAKSGKQYIYLLRVLDYRTVDDLAPLNYVKDHVKNIILNKRKINLIKNLEDSLYTKALRENEIKIHSNYN